MRAEREDGFEAQDEPAPDRLIVPDGTATAAGMVRRHGWAPRGEGCRACSGLSWMMWLRRH